MLSQDGSLVPADSRSTTASPRVRIWQAPVLDRSVLEVVKPEFPDQSIVARRLRDGLPIVAGGGNRAIAYRAFRRTLDIAGASLVLLAALPVMLIVLVALAITTKGRPLFAQDRAGFRGRKFRMYKFRTMRLDADKMQHLVRNEQSGPVFKNRRDPRITRLGRFLRATSIDELPQLFNVLRGDMSLVGPRPLPVHEVARMEPWQRRRQAVLPGLTCLWQVSGRSSIGFHDWVRMDLWYVKNQGIWTDLRLLLKTPAAVLACRGAY